jgi:hypothetical protein
LDHSRAPRDLLRHWTAVGNRSKAMPIAFSTRRAEVRAWSAQRPQWLITNVCSKDVISSVSE